MLLPPFVLNPILCCIILRPCRLGLYSKVVAKLEDIEGLVNHTEILDAADAVVFSRGSLGTCMAVEKVCI